MDSVSPSPLFFILAFAVLNEAVIEYFLGNIQSLKPYLPILSLSTAILLTFSYEVNIFFIFLGTKTTPFLDFLLSAFIISRLSNYINDFVQKVLGSK